MSISHVASAALLLGGTSLCSAQTSDDFAARCARLPQEAVISVVFKDREVARDDSRTVQELNRLAGKPPGDFHSVYGLTRAVPALQLRAAARVAPGNDGRVCAVPDIALEIGFSDFIVYLAKELTDPCRQDIVRQHEQEHVETWKSHWRATAKLLPGVLRRQLGEARPYDSATAAVEGINQWARELIAPWPKRILDTVLEGQAAIDTRVSYDIVASRLRTCGQTVRGGSR